MSSPGEVRSRRPLVLLGVVVSIGSLVAAVWCVVMVGSAVGGPLADTLTAPSRPTPVDEAMALEEGRHTVFELVGRSSGSGGIETHVDGPTTIGPGSVSVEGPSGPLPVSATTFDETIERMGDRYRGVARFVVPASGEYRVRISAPGSTRVVVAPSLGSGFGAVGGWLAGAAASLLALVLGLVLVLVGFLRGRTPSPPAGAPASPPPVPVATPAGWYPDPHAPHLLRYWDGRAWTHQVTRRS